MLDFRLSLKVFLLSLLLSGLLAASAQAISLNAASAHPCRQPLLSYKSHLANQLQQRWQGPFLQNIRQHPDDLLKQLDANHRRKALKNLQNLGQALARLRWDAFMSADMADYRGNIDLRFRVAKLRSEIQHLADILQAVRPPEIENYTIFNGFKIYRPSSLENLAPNLWQAYLHYSGILNQLVLSKEEQQRLAALTAELKKSPHPDTDPLYQIDPLDQNRKHLLWQWEDFTRGNQEVQQIGRLHLENTFNEHLAYLLGHARAYLVAQLVITEFTSYGPRYAVEILLSPNHKISEDLKEKIAPWLISGEDLSQSYHQHRQLVIPPQV